MAEAAVGLAINKLDVLLTGEVKLLRNVHRELEDVKDELETIKSFLRDADARLYQGNVDSRIKTWLKQVRQVAFQIEDVIDEYMLHVGRHQDQKGYLHKLTLVVKNLKPRHAIASKIRAIKTSIGGIRERMDRYNFNFLPEEAGSDKNDTWHDPRVHSLFVEEAELVGIESPKAELIGRLTEGTTKNAVISVVGMGGLGKTTLAKKVYDFESVTAHFDCKAWITVSQSYKKEELLRSMIRQFQREKMQPAAFEGIDTMSELLLIEKLRQYLSDKKFVVVFDDVWQVGFWGYIKTLLPDNDKGSRIIITTRNEGVAPSPGESQCYSVQKLEPLAKTKAYELFCKKVLESNAAKCPSELEELSHAIVEKCEGLPLAIVTIGGLLATKEKTVSEWKKFYDGLSSSLASDQRLSSITTILSMSYHDLPYYLKSCFLYLSKFPEDYSIKCWKIIRLWIAEGFVRERQGQTLEEVAEEYLTELIHRSLVQVAEVNPGGKAKVCRVHDLMREVIVYRSRDLGFHQISMDNYQSFKGKSRHLSIANEVKNLSESSTDAQLHSINLFKVDKLPKYLISSFIKNFKHLRALDFEGAPLDYLPKEVGNLWHLRYLSIKGTDVKTLPKSIGKLCNLETLDLRESFVYDLPVEINKLLKLRHLLASFINYDVEYNPNSSRGVKIHGNIGCLEALQKLSVIEVDHHIGLISQVERLTQLRKLRIKKLKRERGLALCSALEKMTCLRSLLVSSVDEEEFLDLQSLYNPPPLLQHLYLLGPLVNFELPHWIPKLMGLVRIGLGWSRLGDKAIEILQALPNLQHLWLWEGYNGKQLHFKTGCFLKLKRLNLESLMELNEVIIDEGALPAAEELSIGPCPRLKELPSGIHFLRNLKKLEFIDIRTEFAIQMQSNGGHDYWKVKHIPLVLFCYKIKGDRYNNYKLGDLDLLKRLKEVS